MRKVHPVTISLVAVMGNVTTEPFVAFELI